MMSSTSEHTMEDIEFEVMEVSEMDKALLMSLMNESNEEIDEADNSLALESVTKSSKNEIDHELNMGSSPSLTVEDYQSEDAALEDYQRCSVSSVSDSSLSYDMDNFDWINDMDIDSSVTCSSLSDDDEMAGINNWYMCTFRNEIEAAGMIEFEGLRDYGSELYYGVHQLEEQSYSSSLWQQTYDSVVYAG